MQWNSVNEAALIRPGLWASNCATYSTGLDFKVCQFGLKVKENKVQSEYSLGDRPKCSSSIKLTIYFRAKGLFEFLF